MKKIGLLLEAEESFGGVFQYSRAMLDAVYALPENDYSIVVAYTSKQWLSHLSANGTKKVHVRKRLWGRVLWRMWSGLKLSIAFWRKICPFFHPVARTLLREQCDLWICPTQSFFSVEIPLPTLSVIHDLMHRYESRFPEAAAPGVYRLREFTNRNSCAWSKGILVDSETGKTHVMESYGVAQERIHVLPYIAPCYDHLQKKTDTVDSRYGLPAKFIFYPAQFWEHKNHKKLIAAIGLLKQDLPDLKLVLAGAKKNGFKTTLQLVQALGLTEDVRFIGYVPEADIQPLYRRARALVMPTFFGPTNIPPLEAFAAGCPVAVSRIYGMPDQVGDAALLFDPQSIDDIAHCIKQLWTDDDLCAELINKGKQKVAAWGQEQFNDRLKEIIDDILR